MVRAEREPDLSDVMVTPAVIMWEAPLGQTVIKVFNNCGRHVALKVECSNKTNFSWVPTYAFLEPRKQEVIVIQRKGAEFQPNECLRVSVARAAMNVMDAQKHFNRTDIKIHTVTIKMMKKPITATSGKEKRPEPVPAAPKPVVVVKATPIAPAPIAVKPVPPAKKDNPPVIPSTLPVTKPLPNSTPAQAMSVKEASDYSVTKILPVGVAPSATTVQAGATAPIKGPAAPKPALPAARGAASATMISTIPTVAPGGPTAAKPLVPAAPAGSATKIQLVPVQVQMKPIQVPPAKSPAPAPAAIVAAKPPLVAVPPVLKPLPPTSPGPAAPVAAVAKPAPVPAPVPVPALTPVPQPAAPVQTPCKCQHAQPSPVPAKSPAAPNQAK